MNLAFWVGLGCHMDSDKELEQLIHRLIIAGWICLSLSALMLVVSTFTDGGARGSEVTQVLWLTGARVVGIASFVIGIIAIFNRRWTHGTLLLAGSIGLPVVSVILHGTI